MEDPGERWVTWVAAWPALSHPCTTMDLPAPDSLLATHPYGTRKSNNVALRPSARLRADPDAPRRSRPSTAAPYPQFPPSHVLLHPDDANSKVFLAIGRAFLSVNNRAMTIKDLAEMVLSYGLAAQNVSAASQAITTYIRTHLNRCDVQQDIPLLLRHVLSGTDSDDDLLPALYSRSGGAHCAAHPESRVTNFRRGTMVWYLSRATGAPCPFAKAGIRLSDYGENGKVGISASEVREKKRAKMLHRRTIDPSCGQKRKRSLRSCNTATATTKDSATDSESDHDKPPPKVKLTLRLKPLTKCTSSSSTLPTQTSLIPSTSIDLTTDVQLSDSDSDSESDSVMSVDVDSESSSAEFLSDESPFGIPSSPVSIPLPHTPPVNEPRPCYPSSNRESFRRSPSAACSISSPPPESEEEEEDDIQISMTGPRHDYYGFSDDEDEDDDDWDEEGEVDSDADGETLWESPGPRSPSAPSLMPPLPDTRVKEEPRDLQEMLDAWDHFDSHLREARMAEFLAQATASLNPGAIASSAVVPSTVKVESQEPWDWQVPFGQRQEWEIELDEQTIRIKQEDLDFGIDSLFPSMGDDAYELENEEGSSPHTLTIPPPTSPGAAALVQLIQALTVQSPTTPTASSMPPYTESSPSPSPPPQPSIPPSSLLLTPPLPHCVSHQVMKVNPCPSLAKGEAEGVVVHTCQPCIPAISATQIEEISVYQMTLGPYLLLRRIDTDFVNLTPIVEWCGKGRGYPVLSTIPNAVVVWPGCGSEKVCGVWVPLEVAQTYVKDLNTCSANATSGETTQGLDVFLNNELVERFPSALKDFHRTNSSGRMLKQFGRWFESMVSFAHAQAAAVATATAAAVHASPTAVPDASCEPLSPQNVMQADSRPSWIQKETVVAVPMTGAIPEQHQEEPSSHVHQDQLRRPRSSKQEDCLDVQSPLSAKEEEIFQELCVIPGEEEERAKVETNDSADGDESEVVVKEEDEASGNVNGGSLEPESSQSPERNQLTSCPTAAPEAKIVGTRTMTTRSTTIAEKQALERQEKGHALRRSKRVADALAAQTQSLQLPKTKSRKKLGARITLS
ncbi:hypothetical protein Agabi119p4_3542 [Agaricus bisporus var. burnettii]|uniref:GDS1 winged helix domain-containing protein n=1 Tax=Agaricus bisporus var. burnettii TaxID=192524 RepID=A0A8H7F4Y7_AGABI|nr:hypothetical protein Agabi119p4_3542 [Agaricus bisporus var. burnettii]